jgi:centrosomal protein POC5
MEMVKLKLGEAMRKNEEYENNKYQLQENLKKAFLRGVCAMNMEAMGVLTNENSE